MVVVWQQLGRGNVFGGSRSSRVLEQVGLLIGVSFLLSKSTQLGFLHEILPFVAGYILVLGCFIL